MYALNSTITTQPNKMSVQNYEQLDQEDPIVEPKTPKRHSVTWWDCLMIFLTCNNCCSIACEDCSCPSCDEMFDCWTCCGISCFLGLLFCTACFCFCVPIVISIILSVLHFAYSLAPAGCVPLVMNSNDQYTIFMEPLVNRYQVTNKNTGQVVAYVQKRSYTASYTLDIVDANGKSHATVTQQYLTFPPAFNIYVCFIEYNSQYYHLKGL